MPPRPSLALGLLHGAADALPVSSSGHVAAAEALLDIEAGDEVGLHAGSLAALVATHLGEAATILRRLTWRRVAMHLAAGAIPAVAGYTIEKTPARRFSPGAQTAAQSQTDRQKTPARRFLPGGMLVGAVLLGAGDLRRGQRSRWEAGPVDGVWLGLAQATALWPGVSRNGATLAVARLRGFAPEEANPLSREVGVPVTLGAVLLRRAPLDAAAAASALGFVAALPLVRVVDRGTPLWPWAAERAAVALALLRTSAP